ncbi:hypothetical protein [Sphingopyxis sp.]|jgi:hypothetical protein|uniref:hypothetical protein n=1 Tax=Sphingopyxis sp. TaxID=1908224 RepID=UPI003F7112A7
MTTNPETNRLHRLWTAVIDASAAMVAIHYAAPWDESASRRGEDRRRDHRENCAA